MVVRRARLSAGRRRLERGGRRSARPHTPTAIPDRGREMAHTKVPATRGSRRSADEGSIVKGSRALIVLTITHLGCGGLRGLGRRHERALRLARVRGESG